MKNFISTITLTLLILSFSPKDALAYDWPSNVIKPDLCSLHADTLLWIIGYNQVGKSISEVNQGERFQPYSKKIYNDIKKHGIDNTRMKTLDNYLTCIDRSGTYKNSITAACIPVTQTSHTILEGIKNNVSENDMMQSWNKSNPNFNEGKKLIK
ncbi:MAG: hypothetical protein AAGB32_03485, partial [Pseudomonadota bacterium]